MRLVAQESEDRLEVTGHDGHGAAAGDLEDGDVLVVFRNLDFEDLSLHCYLRPRVVQLELVQGLHYRCDRFAIRLRLLEYQLSLRSRRLCRMGRRRAELLDESEEGLLSGSRRATVRCYRGRCRKMWSWWAFAVAAGSECQFVVLSSFEPNRFWDLMRCVAELGNQNRALHQALGWCSLRSLLMIDFLKSLSRSEPVEAPWGVCLVPLLGDSQFLWWFLRSLARRSLLVVEVDILGCLLPSSALLLAQWGRLWCGCLIQCQCRRR